MQFRGYRDNFQTDTRVFTTSNGYLRLRSANCVQHLLKDIVYYITKIYGSISI